LTTTDLGAYFSAWRRWMRRREFDHSQRREILRSRIFSRMPYGAH
jgi:hypothetical protein